MPELIYVVIRQVGQTIRLEHAYPTQSQATTRAIELAIPGATPDSPPTANQVTFLDQISIAHVELADPPGTV